MPRLSDLLPDSESKKALSAMAGKARSAAMASRHADRRTGPRRGDHDGDSPPVPDFVAVDCETTGLDDKRDRIIEIGAVKFIRGEPAAEFSTFVNPSAAIPAEITDLTGITDADVAGAPAFADVAPRLLEFIGDAAVCGHQVDFDTGFLSEELKRLGRPKLTNPAIDTALLARIVLPKLGAYSLKYVSHSVDTALDNAHRALDDAKASGKVAVMLIRRIGEIAPFIRRKMALFAPHSVLKDLLFKSLDGQGRVADRPARPFPDLPRRLSLPEEYGPIDIQEVAALFAAKSALGRSLSGYVPRPSQADMAQSVARALNGGELFAAEAGTGTGKSLAYCIPAALFALKNSCRVLVSTHTRNLQDQLVSNDIPIVKSVVGEGLTAAVLKGRANYLCRLRYIQLIGSELGNFSPRERAGVLPLIRWAEETHTGDIEEQNQFNRKWFTRVWNLVSAETHDCKGRQCPLADVCFLLHARQKALCSHLVVINHALFFSEICAASSFLGKIGPIIFDEAHHLESCGHRYLRVEVDTNRFNLYLEFVNNAVKRTEHAGAGDADSAKAAKALAPLVKRLRKSAAQWQADVRDWARRRQNAAQFQIGYRDRPFDGSAALGETDATLAEIQDTLRHFGLCLAEKDDVQAWEELAGEITICGERTSQLKADLSYASAGVTDDHVFWCEGDRDKGWVKLCGVPLDIGDMLASVWDQSGGAVVFTSATLMVGDTMDYVRRKLGLTQRHEARTRLQSYPTPFTGSQLIAGTIASLPDPQSPGYAAAAAQTVAAMSRRLGKNILVLFTNVSTLQEVYGTLKGLPDIDKSKLFAQNISGNRHATLDLFKQSRGGILLGTDSFWEGVDAPGETCEIVAIARLPFPVPTHPLVKAICDRCEAEFGDSFMTFSVPEAIIKFRQGAGRLIRSVTDRGALIVLDNRIVTKGYGKHFVRALNTDFRMFETGEEMLREVERFFIG